jgi:ABC-type transporter MlaC component
MRMRINTNKNFMDGFKEYVKKKYGNEPFYMSDAWDDYFKLRYNTTDSYIDPKNLSGTVQRLAKNKIDFEFMGKKINPRSKKENTTYRLLNAKS